MNSIGGTSNVWGSYVWIQGPRFGPGFGTVLGANVAFMIVITGYKLHVNRENRKLDAGQRVKFVTQEQMDLGWRYVGY